MIAFRFTVHTSRESSYTVIIPFFKLLFNSLRKFSRFFNLPELSLLFSQVSVFHATDKSGLPEFKGYDDKRNQIAWPLL